MASKDFTPVDLDAEASVISVLLTTPDAFVDVSERLHPEDFGVTQLGLIYEAMLALDAAGMPIDQITLADELKRRKTLSKIGGKEALGRLVERGTDIDNVTAHVSIVKDKALLRRILSTSRSITTNAMEAEKPSEDILAEAEQAVFAIGQERAGSTLVGMPEAVAELNAEMARIADGQMLGVPTGFPVLDRLTSGLQPEQLVIIGGRPGSGKSAFMIQLARYIAETTGQLVPYLSYEMSTSELTFRLLAQAVGHPLQALREGKVDRGRERDIGVELAKMAQLPLLIDSQPPSSVSGVRSEMRRLARRGEIGAVFVDYLQLMRGDRRTDNRAQEIGEISRGLKRLASELGVPIIAGSQLSRAAMGGPGGGSAKPQLHHLRESGDLEQDASVVLLMHRPYATGEVGVSPKVASALLAKQRSGPAGIEIPLDFEPDWAAFYSSTRPLDDAPPPPEPPMGGGRRGQTPF
jgi:replicative DNA helicase